MLLLLHCKIQSKPDGSLCRRHPRGPFSPASLSLSPSHNTPIDPPCVHTLVVSAGHGRQACVQALDAVAGGGLRQPVDADQVAPQVLPRAVRLAAEWTRGQTLVALEVAQQRLAGLVQAATDGTFIPACKGIRRSVAFLVRRLVRQSALLRKCERQTDFLRTK